MAEEVVVHAGDGASLWTAVEGRGPPVLLCHGGPGLWDYLGGLSSLLCSEFRVHRWDQRSCGRSGPAADYGIERAVHDVQIDEWQRVLDDEIAERRQFLDHVARTLDSTEVIPMQTDTSRAQLDRAIPVLASLNIEETQRFYADKLGFAAVARYPDYGIVERDGVQIHLWLTDDADIPRAT